MTSDAITLELPRTYFDDVPTTRHARRPSPRLERIIARQHAARAHDIAFALMLVACLALLALVLAV